MIDQTLVRYIQGIEVIALVEKDRGQLVHVHQKAWHVLALGCLRPGDASALLLDLKVLFQDGVVKVFGSPEYFLLSHVRSRIQGQSDNRLKELNGV